jgi:hypothetical protein
METVVRIEDFILAGSEGFFDEGEIKEDLHVTIRIAGAFYEFLLKSGDQPSTKEIAYVTDTIRSGIDEFFALAYICRLIDTRPDTWSFDPNLQWNFADLREKFLCGFEQLAKASEATAIDRLASLLRLTHLELVFLARYFPSAILSFAGPQPSAEFVSYVSSGEFLSYVSEWKAGRRSFEDVQTRLLDRVKDKS